MNEKSIQVRHEACVCVDEGGDPTRQPPHSDLSPGESPRRGGLSPTVTWGDPPRDKPQGWLRVSVSGSEQGLGEAPDMSAEGGL